VSEFQYLLALLQRHCLVTEQPRPLSALHSLSDLQAVSYPYFGAFFFQKQKHEPQLSLKDNLAISEITLLHFFPSKNELSAQEHTPLVHVSPIEASHGF
jgi:hypothetical protein